MRKSHLFILIGLLLLLLAINQLAPVINQSAAFVGGLPLYGWLAILLLLLILGLLFAQRTAARAYRLLEKPPPPDSTELQQRKEEARIRREVHDPTGPEYPHPFILVNECISCNACVEACPHDVLTMAEMEVEGEKKFVANVIRRDLCMEDTSCEAICPTSPKACIVINSTKEIKILPKPIRYKTYMTNVPGCYVIGDVSGTPLIRNAVKEGVEVIQYIREELNDAPPEPKTKLPVIIIGIGPAGLSAVLAAKQQNLEFVGLEQRNVLAVIKGYPSNKRMDFKPKQMKTNSSLQMKDAGNHRENILESWTKTLEESGIKINKMDDGDQSPDLAATNVINEGEVCRAVKRAEDGDYFIVSTERGAEKEKRTYLARRVVLAIGLRGAPMKLRDPEGKLLGKGLERLHDGKLIPKVLDNLSEPEKFRNCKLIVVGGGNSAIEAAVSLVARRKGDELEFLSPGEMNDVTLMVRSDFGKDVKFINKQQIYKCKDEGKIKIRFRTVITEVHQEHVIIEDKGAKKQEPLDNDFVFALIGGESPKEFLKATGIHILEAKKK
jgi:thioredoxin reductase (NADPH)